jgi:hypothetical protein
MTSFLSTSDGDGSAGAGLSYFYRSRTQDVISVDDVNDRVRIRTWAPTVALDVHGCISCSSNVAACNVATAVLSADTVAACNVTAADVYTSTLSVSASASAATLTASNVEVHDSVHSHVVTCSNLDAADSASALVLNAGSNLMIGGRSLNDPYPENEWTDLIPFHADLSEGFIDQSWLKKKLSAKDVLTDLWDLADAGFDIAEAIYDAYKFFHPDQGLPPGTIDALKEALQQDEESGSNAVKLGWQNLLHRPIAAPPTSAGASGPSGTSVGIAGDLLCSDASSLRVVPGTSFGRDVQDNLTISGDLSTAEELLNFSTGCATLEQVNVGSNATIAARDSAVRLHGWSLCNGTIRHAGAGESATARLTWSNAGDGGTLHISSNALVEGRLTATTLAATAELQTGRWVPHEAGAGTSGSNAAELEPGRFSVRLASSNGASRVDATPDAISFSRNDDATPLWRCDASNMYLASGELQTPGELTLRATAAPSLDDPYKEGRLVLAPESLRFWAQSNDVAGTQYRQLWLSTTSHGLFLQKRSAVHGPLETLSELNAQDPLSGVSFTRESWARLESSLTDGLRWGSGLSNNTLAGGQNRDYFSVDRRGVLSTLDATTSLMQPHTDSNGDIVHNTTRLTTQGAITVGDALGRTLVTAGGTLQRRADPDSSTGFQVTPNCFMTVGGTSLTPEGALTTTQLITACNAAAASPRPPRASARTP